MDRADGVCHRCGGAVTGVEGESTFCPHCGAPQLRVLEEHLAKMQPGGGEGGSTTGTLPPPNPGMVRWRAVVVFAALVACISALLMVGVFWVPAAFPFAWLWTVCGAVLVLALYRRRHPETVVNPRVGARIGLIYGLLAVGTMSLAVAVSGLTARFGLHRMGNIDSFLYNAMHQAVEQQVRQSVSPGSGVPAITADQAQRLYSPEVRAGIALLAVSVVAMFLVVFSTAGGAVGGLLRVRPRSPEL